MESPNKNSYNFESLLHPDQQKELERLKAQSLMFKEREKDLLVKSGLQPHHRVLEIGCGPGFTSQLIVELIPKGHLTSIDIDSSFERIWQSNMNDKLHQAEFRPCSASVIPLPDSSIDFIYIRFVLQHVKNSKPLLDEARRLLRPGGKILILDSDDDLIVHHPRSPKFAKFLEIAQENQNKKGGDRKVGQKLYQKLKLSGLKPIQVNILTFSLLEIPFEAFLNMLLGFKGLLINDKVFIQSVKQELYDSYYNEGLYLSAGVFVALGEKTTQ